MRRVFSVVIERDEDGLFIGDVPELPGCHSQAQTKQALLERVKEAILLYLETQGEPPTGIQFVGVDKVEVSA